MSKDTISHISWPYLGTWRLKKKETRLSAKVSEVKVKAGACSAAVKAAQLLRQRSRSLIIGASFERGSRSTRLQVYTDAKHPPTWSLPSPPPTVQLFASMRLPADQ